MSDPRNDIRSSEKVLESHLKYRKDGDLEGDLKENYAEDVVLLSHEGVHHGHDGVRYLADVLNSYLPEGSYEYHQVLTAAEVGMLTWTGAAKDLKVHDGVDSFVFRNGKITAQTIHFSTSS